MFVVKPNSVCFGFNDLVNFIFNFNFHFRLPRGYGLCYQLPHSTHIQSRVVGLQLSAS